MPKYTFVRRMIFVQSKTEEIEAVDGAEALLKMNELQNRCVHDNGELWCPEPEATQFPAVTEDDLVFVDEQDVVTNEAAAEVLEANRWVQHVGKKVHVTGVVMGSLREAFTGTLVGIAYPPHDSPYADVQDLDGNVWSVDFPHMKVAEVKVKT